MLPSLNRNEILTLLFLGALVLIGFALPTLHPSEQYHQFANQRVWLGIPHFADVASNFVFTITGLLGLFKLRQLDNALQRAKLSLTLFFLGLLLTSAGSAYYHLAPTTESLVWDRIPMVIAFSGIIGAFLTMRVSSRLGNLGIAYCLSIGLLGLLIPGQLSWYAVLQFGGLHGILLGAIFLEKYGDPFPWGGLLLWYAIAKVLEHFDASIWAATNHYVSGHTLKHLAAGIAGALILKHLPVKSKERLQNHS